MLRLPLADQALLDELGYKKKLQEVDRAIMANASFLSQIVANPEIFGHDLSLGSGDEVSAERDRASGRGMGGFRPSLVRLPGMC